VTLLVSILTISVNMETHILKVLRLSKYLIKFAFTLRR